MAEAIRDPLPAIRPAGADRGRRIGLGCSLVGLLVAVGSVSWWALKGKHWAPITGTVVGATLAVGCCVRARMGMGRQAATPEAPVLDPMLRRIRRVEAARAQMLAHQRTVVALPLRDRREASVRLGGEMARQLLEIEEEGPHRGDPVQAVQEMAVWTMLPYFQRHPVRNESDTWLSVQTCVQILSQSVRNRGITGEDTSAAMLEAWINVIFNPEEHISFAGRGCFPLTLPVYAEATRFVFIEILSGRLHSNARVLDFLRQTAAPLTPTHWAYVTGPVDGVALDPVRVQALRQSVSYPYPVS